MERGSLRAGVELEIFEATGDVDLASRAGECTDILLSEGILSGDETVMDAISEVILQAIAEG